MLSFRIFEQLELALKTEFAPKFSSRGWAAAPPSPLTPLVTIIEISCQLKVIQAFQDCGSPLPSFMEVNNLFVNVNRILCYY